MAEAAGLAASVAGLISLGFQVTQGLVNYIDALKSREDELLSLKQRNDAFSSALAVISTASSTLPRQHKDAAVAVLHSVRSCSHDLRAVQRLLAELAPSHAGTWRDRFRNKKKKLTYFIDRSKLQDLANRLDSANSALQLALAGLGLDISRLYTDKLSAIESSSQDTSTLVTRVSHDVTEFGKAVREIHSHSSTLYYDISAAGQLMVAHSRVTAAQQRKNLKHLEEIKCLLQHLQKENTQIESPELGLVQLTTKPAALKAVCDKMDLRGQGSLQGAVLNDEFGRQQLASATRPHITPSDYADQYSCICQGRAITSTAHEGRYWGPVLFSSESSTTGHCSRCPFARVANTRCRTVRMSYTGILQSAIGISFSITSGAGGFSISPGFTYYPTVDEWSDPAFRILRLLGWGRSWELDTNRLFYTACLKRLARLFCEGRAFPTVVNDRNQTLMHIATKAARHLSMNTKSGAGLEELLQLLLSYNVPAFSYDCSGHSPLVSFRPSSYALSDWGSSGLWISTLSKQNTEGRPVALRKVAPNPYGDGTRTLACYNGSLLIAKAYGCGPLSLAVVSNDAKEVEHLVRRFPIMLDEIDDHGYSPLHLAINKPDCLKALVSVASIAQLNQQTYGGSSVLDLAMQASSGVCAHGRRHQKCRRCSCARCVAILLQAGCAVRRVDRHFGALFAKASERSRRRYVCHMAKLKTAQWKTNRLKGYKGEDVYRYLFLDHNEHDKPHVELFYRHGIRPGPGYPYGLARASPAYICWLIDHGVDLFLGATEPPTESATSAPEIVGTHHAYYAVGSWSKMEDAAPEMDKMISMAPPHQPADGCQCHCSVGGCTPFIWMVKGAKARRSSPLQSRGFYRLLESFFWLCNPKFTKPSFVAAIRYATFEALGLNHTCCAPHRIVARGAQCAGRDDAHLINEEQAVLLELHESLLVEFQGEASKALQAASADGSPLAEFWRSHWLVRVQAELRSLDGAALTEAERRAAEDLGVQWCASAGTDRVAARKPSHYLAGTLAYWFYELDQICPEYKEPWPQELAKEWRAVEQMSPEEQDEWEEGREWRRFEEWVLARLRA